MFGKAYANYTLTCYEFGIHALIMKPKMRMFVIHDCYLDDIFPKPIPLSGISYAKAQKDAAFF